MTKLKLSAKMHIMIIVSALIVAVGLAVGLICHFTADGYFNYGADYKSYRSVVVDYSFVDFPEEDTVIEICDKAFSDAGLKAYSLTSNLEGNLVYSFSYGADGASIDEAVKAINTGLTPSGSSGLSNAYSHTDETLLGGGHALVYGAIALASAVVLQFLYFIIRYKLAMALAALLADMHNLAIFLSLLAITRLPVGSTVFAFATLTVVLTMIGCAFLFDRVRKNIRNEKLDREDSFMISDLSAGESFRNATAVSVGVAVFAIILFVLMSISAMSVTLVLTSALCPLIAAISCVYGTSFFTPAVYSRFMRIGDGYKAKHLKQSAKK